ncbi:MAG: rhodanese-like domain-containing protein [Bacteroidota bacterium]|nr:rhodanese-like domain-containing protein [Bacteroidota bacterium]
MTNITPEEVKKRMDAGETLNLVDVREPEENAAFNIGGILLPLGRIQRMETREIDHLRDQEVICYCRSGGRSGNAAYILEQMGYKNVRNLVGGMLAWQDRISK